jgi:L-ascorbate metabolism protein UlaG (beta-lactamase superfamily)/pimeloyl-ACP methyl ester carboxylesterase
MRLQGLIGICAVFTIVLSVPSAAQTVDTAIHPFTIHISDAAIADLKARLTRARIADPLQGDGWALGTDVPYLKELVAYWRDRFDWRAQERRLNRLEQFTTTIDGLTIHFVHRRSKRPDAFPLLITHGWPGSFVEFDKIVGPLTDPPAGEIAFDVVAPSIPGFAFSGKPRESGFAPPRIAEIEAKLMARLGYTRYGVQGGDWGSIISQQIARSDAAHVAGLHMNMCRTAPPAGGGDPTAGLTDAEKARLKLADGFRVDGAGYQEIQGTKPQTIGIALNDSPVSLAAWIVEKFQAWCDCDGNPETAFTKDEMLTNISLYWFTQTAGSSARIYYETRHASPAPAAAARVEAPTACADFPKEPIWAPRAWFAPRYNITRWTTMPRGGHFAALEQPELLVADVRAFFRDVQSGSKTASTPALTITPLLHASVQIEYGGQVVQVDPWSRADLARAKPADLILVTDDPIHHLDPAAIRQLRKPGAPVLVPAVSHAKFPEGVAIANGERQTIGGITVEAIPAYDTKPGESFHPKGKSNGYVVTVGGRRLYFTGPTQCVPEIRALKDIDVAFFPMNLPAGRMEPADAAECVNAFKPKAVYINHYDQGFASGAGVTSGIAKTVDAFRAALDASIEFRSGDWYPR